MHTTSPGSDQLRVIDLRQILKHYGVEQISKANRETLVAHYTELVAKNKAGPSQPKIKRKRPANFDNDSRSPVISKVNKKRRTDSHTDDWNGRTSNPEGPLASGSKKHNADKRELHCIDVNSQPLISSGSNSDQPITPMTNDEAQTRACLDFLKIPCKLLPV